MRIGVVGVGRMGGPIAANLLRAGYPVTVFDIDAARCRELAALGAEVAVSPAELAAGSDISFSVVMTDAILRGVTLDPTGILSGAAPGHLFCDLSTVSPAVSAEVALACAAASVGYLRAKVVGSVPRAVDGTLTVLASGDRADYDRLEPVFACIGERSVYLGDAEAAHYLKLVHSILVGVYAALLGEALAFGEKGGLDLGQMLDVLREGPLASAQLSLKAPTVVARDFDRPPSDIDTAAKDLDMVLDAAVAAGVPMPITTTVREAMARAQAAGDGKRDIWSILETFEAAAGLR
jgi:3-hydroxyisobutyrate dehydrogenase-like beta-hydroxyacid dehydrogenase